MLSKRAYENKLETVYGHIIGRILKLSQTISHMFMPVDKLK